MTKMPGIGPRAKSPHDWLKPNDSDGQSEMEFPTLLPVGPTVGSHQPTSRASHDQHATPGHCIPFQPVPAEGLSNPLLPTSPPRQMRVEAQEEPNRQAIPDNLQVVEH